MQKGNGLMGPSSDGVVGPAEIPAALPGSPTSWKRHFYGRDHEALVALNLHELEQIRMQSVQDDWSAQICQGAMLSDLDPDAIAFARQEYKNKKPNLGMEVDGWSDDTFLNKAKVCIGGKITRAAIVLLGRPESDHFLESCHPQLSWILKESYGEAKREDIDSLLRKKLSDVLTESQKTNVIRNLLQEMRRNGAIEKVGSSRGPSARWSLSKPLKNGPD